MDRNDKSTYHMYCTIFLKRIVEKGPVRLCNGNSTKAQVTSKSFRYSYELSVTGVTSNTTNANSVYRPIFSLIVMPG